MTQAGIKNSVRPYVGTNAQQIKMSLEEMSSKMRDGAIDASVRGWALDCLKQAGLDGRDATTTPFKQAAALLECFRKATVYAPDPYATELIPSAGATLCLRPNLCLNGEDCDGLTAAYGSLCLSVGIPVQIVKQSYGPDKQDHVLTAVFTGDDWHYADPSTNLPFGSTLGTANETWIDPFGPVGALPEQEARIVTFGKPPWLGSLGQASSPITLPDPDFAELPFTNTPNADAGGFSYQLVDGNRYRFQVLVSPNSDGSVAQSSDVENLFANDLNVEAVTSAGAGDAQGYAWWYVQGVALRSGSLDSDTNRSFIDGALQINPSAPTPQTLLHPQAAGIPDPAAPQDAAVGMGTMLAVAGGIAVVGGLGFYFWHGHHGHRRRR